MTYSVPDPASESPDPVAPDPATSPSAVVGPDGSGVEQAAIDDPPLPTRLGAPADDFGPMQTDAPPPRHAASEGFDAPAADAPPAPPQAQVADVDETPAAPMAGADTPVVPNDAGSANGAGTLQAAADEPLRVAHQDSEDYEKFVTDPEAAEEATRVRMDAQAEEEKAAAGITPAAEDS